jgi:hypothetical protein
MFIERRLNTPGEQFLHFSYLLRPPYAPVTPGPCFMAFNASSLCIRNAARVLIGELAVQNVR